MNNILKLQSTRNLQIFGVLAIVAIICIGMLTPNIGIPFKHVDKFVHCFVFFATGMALLTFLPLPKSKSILLLFALAVILEIGQVFVPGRTVSLMDCLANLTGVLIAIEANRLMLRKSAMVRSSSERPDVTVDEFEPLPAPFHPSASA